MKAFLTSGFLATVVGDTPGLQFVEFTHCCHTWDPVVFDKLIVGQPKLHVELRPSPSVVNRSAPVNDDDGALSTGLPA